VKRVLMLFSYLEN